MTILQHITDANIAAFNNMLRHVSQKGSDKTLNKRAGNRTPVVQFSRAGQFSQFISYNEIHNTCHLTDQRGTIELWLSSDTSRKLIEISADSYTRRYPLNEN